MEDMVAEVELREAETSVREEQELWGGLLDLEEEEERALLSASALSSPSAYQPPHPAGSTT